MFSIQDIITHLNKFFSGIGYTILPSHDTELSVNTFDPIAFFACLDRKECSTARSQIRRSFSFPYRVQLYSVFLKTSEETPLSFWPAFIPSFFSSAPMRVMLSEKTMSERGISFTYYEQGKEIASLIFPQRFWGAKIMDGQTIMIANFNLVNWAMSLQQKQNIEDVIWSYGRFGSVTYGDIYGGELKDFSKYEQDVELQKDFFDAYHVEAKKLIEKKLLKPAYEYVLKMTNSAFLMSGKISNKETFSLDTSINNIIMKIADEYRKKEL